MNYPLQALERFKLIQAAAQRRPLTVIFVAGCVSTLAYVLFVILPFFIPKTDRSHFPPYLALPETGFELSNYYLLYIFICLNALAMFGLYLFVLKTGGGIQSPVENASEASLRSSKRAARIIFAFSVLFHLIMLAAPFLLSTDIFDYIRHGRILAVYGENPLVVPATYFPQDPFFSLGGWVGTGSVYGSFHVYVMAMLSRLAGDGFAANFFVFKGFFVVIDLLNLWMIWKITARVSPGMEKRALLFYGWNPFILTLIVANAHNDILMLSLVLAGFLLYLDKRALLGVLCLTLATLVKFITLPILVIYVALILRRQKDLRKRVVLAVSSVIVAGSVSFLGYLPLWAGRDTFNYLTTVGQKTNFTMSELLRDAAAGHIQLSMSNLIVQFTLGGILAAFLIWHVWGIKNAKELFSASAGLAFLTPLVLFWFQPWYLTLALGLVALRPQRIMYVASLVFSFSVMFFDSFWWHAPVSMDIQKPLRVLVVFGPPMLLLIVLKMKEHLPSIWQRLLEWSFAPDAEGRSGLRGASLSGRKNLVDPSPLRLAVEISVLAAAAVVPMLVVVSTSPQLKSLIELMFLKLQLLIS